MTSQRKWFHKYEPIVRGYIYIYHALKIVGIGTIKINMFDGIIYTIDQREINGTWPQWES